MKNPFKKEKHFPIVPVFIVVAAAAAAAYLFITDDGSDVRNKIGKNLNKGWDTVKDNMPSQRDIKSLKNKVADTISSLTSTVNDISNKAKQAIA